MKKILEAAEAELVVKGKPLSPTELAQGMISSGSWTTTGKTPGATVGAAIYVNIKELGDNSRFVKTGPSSFGLRGRDAAAAKTIAKSGKVAGVAAVDDEPVSWMFQVDPKHYDLVTRASQQAQEDWRMPALHEKAAIGDPVAFVIVGKTAGLYAMGRVASKPVSRPVVSAGKATGKNEWWVVLQYDSLVTPPISREDLLKDPVLSTFFPFRGLPGTNFRMPAEVFARLEELIADRRRPLIGTVLGLEKARQSLLEHQDEVRHAILEKIRSLPPTGPGGFENLALRLFTALGFTEVEVSGGAGDRSIDLHGYEPAPIGPKVPFIAQAKRNAADNKVAGGVVRKLRGTRRAGQKMYVVTTSSFTPQAVEEAGDGGLERVVLIDGDQFAQLLMEHGIGATREKDSASFWHFDPSSL